MKKEDITLKETKQGLLVVLDSTLEFEALLECLRVRLKDFPREDLTGDGQVIVDLGNRDVSQVDIAKLEPLFFEQGLFLKRIMSRPDLPTDRVVIKNVTQVKPGSSSSRSKTKGSENRTKVKAKTRRKSTSENTGAEVIPISMNQDGVKSQERKPDLPLEPENEAAAEIAATTLLNDSLNKRSEGLVVDKAGTSLLDSPPEFEDNQEPISEVISSNSEPRDTVLLHRSLRSGQSIHYQGNVVIMGDVNPGAEVIAEGNIVVMGSFRGVAHAGATGDESATITAFRLRPTQLRIAGHITRSPDEEQSIPDIPETARIREGIVVIEKY